MCWNRFVLACIVDFQLVTQTFWVDMCWSVLCNHYHVTVRYFDCIDICKYRPDWMEIRTSGELVANSLKDVSTTEIQVFETTEVEFGLFQQRARYIQFGCASVTCARAFIMFTEQPM